MTDEPMHDEEFDALLEELEDAGYVERYTNEDGQAAMRLTGSGEQVARQLAMVAEDDAASMMVGLLGDELEGEDDGTT
jgi:DNA-binding MarR family transcriptional regulator